MNMMPQGYPLVAITGVGSEDERGWLVVGWEEDEFKTLRPRVVPAGMETKVLSAMWLAGDSVVWQVLGSK